MHVRKCQSETHSLVQITLITSKNVTSLRKSSVSMVDYLYWSGGFLNVSEASCSPRGMVYRRGAEPWAQSCNSGGVVSESWVVLK